MGDSFLGKKGDVSNIFFNFFILPDYPDYPDYEKRERSRSMVVAAIQARGFVFFLAVDGSRAMFGTVLSISGENSLVIPFKKQCAFPPDEVLSMGSSNMADTSDGPDDACAAANEVVSASLCSRINGGQVHRRRHTSTNTCTGMYYRIEYVSLKITYISV